MSGGSFNYICFKDAEDLINHIADIKDMAEKLESLGYASYAAKETREVVQLINDYIKLINTKKRNLNDVWQAVEWWQSGDSNEVYVKDALEHYREV